jgi:1-acyl-sn-glycerol-3-phosphate acyltransferase
VIFLRSALFNLLFLGGTALTVLFGLPMLAARPPMVIAFVRGWARLMIALLRIVCGIRLEVTGLENIPPGGVIIAAKHQSAFDTVVWLVLLRSPVYVMKKELGLIPFWGMLARHCGNVTVDRAGGASALKAMVRDSQAALARGRPLVLFPEGTRSAPGEKVPYQPGVAALAAASGAPVVPAATNSGLFWGRRAFHKRPGTIHVSVLPPLPPGLPRKALMAALETVIETESDRLAALSHPVDKPGDGTGSGTQPEHQAGPSTP